MMEPLRDEPVRDPLGSPLARAAFEASPAGLLVLAADGTILAMNGAFARLYDLHAEGLVGCHYSAFADGLKVRRLDGEVGPESWVTPRALRGERVEAVLQTIRNARSGREFVARCGAVPLFEEGRLVATTVAVEDVTEHVRAQQAIEGALSAAEAGTYRIDLVEQRVWGDPNFARLYGLTQEEANGGPLSRIYDLMHPDDKARVSRGVAATTRSDGFHELEYRVVLPSGGTRWLLSRGRAEFDEHGAAVQRIGSIVDVTDRRESEAALRRTQESLGLAMRGSRMGWWRRDLLTGEVVWSPELEEIFGLAAGTFDGARQSFLDFVHPQHRARLASAVDRALAEGEDYAIEFLFTRTDGSEGWMEGRGKAVYEAGRPVASYGIGVDITERKLAEEALRRSAETFESLVRNSPFGIYVVDADFRLALVSQGAQRVFANVRPLLGRDFAEVLETIWEEPFASGAITAFRRVLETGEPFHSPRTVERRSDVEDVESYDWRVERIAMPDGRLAAVCNFYDLSERLRYEAALKDAKARTDAILVSADVATWVLDVQNDRLYADRNLARFFDIDDATASGGPAAAYIAKIHPEDQARVASALGVSIAEGVPYDIEYRIVAKGEERWVTARGIPERGEDGRVVRLPGVVVDVTQLKRAQGALADANRGLEDKVRKRTADLQASNEALNGFTYHVAHDLRAPLRSIASTSRIVMEDFADALPQEAVGQLVRQARAATKMGALIDDLLRLSKLSQQAVERAPIDLTRLAREVAHESLSAHPGTSVRVEAQEGIEAWADPRLLRLALGNLVENAVKYSPEGGTVRVGRHADGAYFVSDEGIGIDPRYFGKVFEPFQRLHSDEEFAGTGIGLSNVRQVVERHSGRIWVESEPGKGATFLFTLG